MTTFLETAWWTWLSVCISAAVLGETMHNLLQNAAVAHSLGCGLRNSFHVLGLILEVQSSCGC